MFYLFLVAILIITLLVLLMFIILKKTVKTINTQTKLYYVDKSQEYDYIINNKLSKLNKIDKELKEKQEKEKNEKDLINSSLEKFDYDFIDLLNKTNYQDRNIFELNKQIDDKFNLDYESLIKEFLNNINESEYIFCLNLRKKFTSNTIYDLNILSNHEREEKLKQLLDKKEYKIYTLYKETNNNHNIDDFINYLEELTDLNSPYLTIYVGDKNKNYNNLSKYIKTVYAKDIYKGIKIKYKNKIYDYSLNERNV